MYVCKHTYSSCCNVFMSVCVFESYYNISVCLQHELQFFHMHGFCFLEVCVIPRVCVCVHRYDLIACDCVVRNCTCVCICNDSVGPWKSSLWLSGSPRNHKKGHTKSVLLIRDTFYQYWLI